MKWLALALALLPLAGCIHTATNEFARCERHARHAYPAGHERAAYLDDIKVCMAMNGFDYNVPGARCTGATSEANRACYVPNQGFEHFLYRHGMSSAVE
jgi:hypothetical protein